MAAEHSLFWVQFGKPLVAGHWIQLAPSPAVVATPPAVVAGYRPFLVSRIIRQATSYIAMHLEPIHQGALAPVEGRQARHQVEPGLLRHSGALLAVLDSDLFDAH